jgi:hypothetical protein
VFFAAIFAWLAVLGLLIMTLMEDRVRGRPATADSRLLKVCVLLLVLALIAFYVWFKINPTRGATVTTTDLGDIASARVIASFPEAARPVGATNYGTGDTNDFAPAPSPLKLTESPRCSHRG